MVDDYPSMRLLLDRSIEAAEDGGGLVPFLHASSASVEGEPMPIEHVMADRRRAWTVKELAELLNMSPRSLYDQIDSGRLEAYKIGDALRLCPAATLDWLRGRIMRPT